MPGMLATSWAQTAVSSTLDHWGDSLPWGTETPSSAPAPPLPPTSQVPDKVFQHHLAVGLDVGAVHVGVEQDDGEGQDEDGVRVVELLYHLGVAHAVALAAVGTRVGREGPALPKLQGGGHSGMCPVL